MVAVGANLWATEAGVHTAAVAEEVEKCGGVDAAEAVDVEDLTKPCICLKFCCFFILTKKFQKN